MTRQAFIFYNRIIEAARVDPFMYESLYVCRQNKTMQQIEQLRKHAIQRLSSLYEPSEAESIFFALLEDVFHVSRKAFLLKDPVIAEKIDPDRMEELLTRLSTGEPVQYVIGFAWFMGLRLHVNTQVLIPRPETEELVQWILDETGALQQPLRIMDVGTGSGCMPIALKKGLPNARVHALDISKAALDLARLNASEQQVEIQFMLADILEWDLIFPDDLSFDVIVSNPPYITLDEQTGMHPNVLEYEPHLALFVHNQAPLLFYETIASFALKHLQLGGQLFFEINRAYGEAVLDLLKKKGFKQLELRKDLSGADRMVRAQV